MDKSRSCHAPQRKVQYKKINVFQYWFVIYNINCALKVWYDVHFVAISKYGIHTVLSLLVELVVVES